MLSSQITRLAPLIGLSILALTAQAAVININEDFNDNLTPVGWALGISNDGGIRNGQLESRPNDGSTVINLPITDVQSATIQFDGSFINSFWGSYTQTFFNGLGLGFEHGTAQANYGVANFAVIRTGGSIHDFVLTPLNPGEFSYLLTLIPGQATYTGTNNLSGIEEFSLSYTDPGITPALISSLSLRAHHTTGAGITYLDNLTGSITTQSTVPEPSTYFLFALTLVGAIAVTNRRIPAVKKLAIES